MIFSLIVLIVIGLVAFFHYTQGMWSATLSAFIAAIAALVAMSYHEPLANLLIAAKMVNQAHSIMLVLLFTLTYVILRVIFDKMIPGNVRLPLLMDKIGAGVMGVVAGLFATGIFAIAAQALPFGASIGGYSRYELEGTREVSVSQGGQRQMLDTYVRDEMTGESFDPANQQGLLVPVDNMVVALTMQQSSRGALSGAREFESVHPNYLDELFGTRIGIEPGVERVALNLDPKEHVKVEGVYRLPKITRQVDAELASTRVSPVSWPADPPAGKTFFVVRTLFDADAADDADKLLRLSPASVRLVTPSTESGGWHNYTPIGTLENGLLFANKPDDYLFVDFTVGSGADWVFLVDLTDIMEDPNAPQPKVRDGVFIEVKRMARVDLADKVVANSLPRSPQVQLLRKPGVLDAAKKLGGGQVSPDATGQPAGAPAAGGQAANATPPGDPSAAPLTIGQAQVNNMLFSPINTGTPEANANGVQIASGTLSLRDGKFAKLDITPVQTLTLMRQGSYTVSELFVPQGLVLVQVSAEPPAEGGDPWAWADTITQFQLKDASGTAFSIHGAFAKVRSGREDRMVATYNADGPINAVSRDENRPTEVYLAFLVPAETQIASLDFNGQPVQPLQLTAQ